MKTTTTSAVTHLENLIQELLIKSDSATPEEHESTLINTLEVVVVFISRLLEMGRENTAFK